MIVGTAGHIDHGKTALVRALTGVDTDRLPEEKARGISIDLGFAYKPLPDGEVLGFVDVPGHVRFIHNMLAGAAGIDFVLLVVAADDGPMPQTREHLAIIDLLGIRRGLVVLTKCDLVDAERRAAALREVAQSAAGTPFEGHDVFQVSVVTGEGVDALERRLSAEASLATRHRAGGHFRMAVDRRFVLPGAGTVVTGTVFAGQVAVGDDVVVTPSGLQARVRGLHANNVKADRAMSGQRCAINLSGPEISIERVHRGDWIAAPELHAPTDRFDAKLRLLTGEARPFRYWTEMHLHIGTAHVAARVALLGETPIPPGGEGLVQIVSQRPLAVLAGDRFVLRQPAAQHTAAGGVVLDPWPPNRGRRRPERRDALTILATRTAEGAVEGLIQCAPGWIMRDRHCRAANLTPGEAGAAISRLVARDLAVELGAFLVSTEAWTGLRQAILDALARHHARVPDAQGLELGRLRLALEKRYPAELVAGAADRLLREGAIGRAGPRIFRQGHTAHLAPVDQLLWNRVRPSLESAPFSPPRVRDIAASLDSTEDRIRALLRRLVGVGLVFEVAHDHFYVREAVAKLAEIAHRSAERHGGVLATSAFRDGIGAGRKIAIQILEFLDKCGVTVRRGDGRVVRREKLASFGPPPADT